MKRPLKLTTRAHGKVNLDLRVLGTRPDGFHELRTVFQAIELHDTLTSMARPGPFAVKCRMPGVPLDDSNLVWRAADGLWKALGRAGEPCDAVVTIDKTIPMQAGLGGGSADAAAALVALARLWGGAPVTLLREVGSGIGADVAFFLSGGTALGLGLG
jgi:4-diphosphocytidyl-2-C-methyl-D-erythritol kinase